MIAEAVRELEGARERVDAALRELGGGRVHAAAPAIAEGVERLCAALSELAWSECDRAMYGEAVGDDE